MVTQGLRWAAGLVAGLVTEGMGGNPGAVAATLTSTLAALVRRG
jgi:hypothetical protein